MNIEQQSLVEVARCKVASIAALNSRYASQPVLFIFISGTKHAVEKQAVAK